MKLHVVLVEPAYPSNMGAAARAIKTMGFEKLRLVAPVRSHLAERSVKTARFALDVLAAAEIFENLEDALRDIDLTIGTTVRKREQSLPVIYSHQLYTWIEEKDLQDTNVALLFGPERTGLRSEHLAYCDLLSYIPMGNQEGSLNLAQAIMIYCYEMNARSHERKETPPGPRKILPKELATLKAQMREALQELEIGRDDRMYERILQSLHKLDRHQQHIVFRLAREVLSRLRNN